MKEHRLVAAVFVALVTVLVCSGQARQTHQFASEAPQLRLWKDSFAKLVFLKSTKADAVALFPDSIDHGGGGLTVIQKDWQIMMLFLDSESNPAEGGVPPEIAGTLVEVRFLARTSIRLDVRSLTKSFKRFSERDVDSSAAWTVYANEDGLSYFLFANDAGGLKAGDVYSVDYGPSERELAKHGL